MAKQLMIYERAVPISTEKHKTTSVELTGNYSFAAEINSVPLVAPEFLPASKDYAIVFASVGETVVPTVIVGIKDGVNNHVDADGNWTHGYVPAFLRRYPFVFAQSPDGKSFTLCVDEEFDGLNTDAKGQSFFDEAGERSEFLEQMINFAREYQATYERTSLFCKRLQELDVLEPAQANFNMPGGETAQLSGFFKINKDKLKAVPAETLAEMIKTEELELCYAHLYSLENLTPMAQRVAQAQAAE